jgi:hypothetical protein
MGVTAGASRRSILSNSIERASASSGAAALFCAGTGVAAVAIDVVFHVPLHLPGHHGLTQMALLIIASCVTRRPWAATLSAATSAALAVPLFGLSPLAPSLYLLSGLVIDGLCLAGRSWRESVWFLAALGGVGNGAKAIEHWLLGGIVAGHGHLMAAGFAFSMFSHVAFGVAGGLLAAQLWLSTDASKKHGH